MATTRSPEKKKNGEEVRMFFQENDVRAAIDKAGGVTRVANLCGVSGSCVYKWLHGKRVPNLEKARILAKEAEMKVEVLRPVL